jgi:hypothetical protein
MSNEQNFNDEFDAVNKIEKSSNSWNEYRSDHKNYVLKETFFKDLNATRNVYFLNEDQRSYELLQCSRGITVGDECESFEQLCTKVQKESKVIPESELVRIQELTKIFGDNITKLNGFCELGFRVPKLLNYYLQKGFNFARGFDVVGLNVMVANQLGFETHKYDFNEPDKDLKIENAGLIVSYHMLEHVSRPDIAIKKIYESMSEGAFFHVEVPVEPGLPRLKYGHLFPFEPHDLGTFLMSAGFEIVNVSNLTHKDGPHIERYLVRKA